MKNRNKRSYEDSIDYRLKVVRALFSFNEQDFDLFLFMDKGDAVFSNSAYVGEDFVEFELMYGAN